MILFAWAVANEGGEPRMTATEYIAQWKDVAVQQMTLHGIPASITLAQGLLESGNGNSDLAKKSNNHFGIKCHSDWRGKKVYHDDDRKGECFRKYKNAADSYRDHSIFLKKRRYEFLFDLKQTDYKAWAKGLKKAGYATDPKYPHKLIDLIERHGLDEYDKKDGSSRGIFARRKKKETSKPAAAVANAATDAGTVTIGSGHALNVHENNIKYVQAKDGDTFASIAEELGSRAGMIARWNDVEKTKKLEPGQVVFIQPKRNKVKGTKVHHVRAGESLWSISQHYGIKLRKLAEYNGVDAQISLTPGQKIRLKKPPRS